MPSAPPVLYHGNYDVWGEHSVNSFGFPYEMKEETSGTLHAVIREVGKPKIGRDLWPAAHPAIYQAGSVTNQEGGNDDEGDETPAGPPTKELEPRWSSGKFRDVDDGGPGHTMEVFDRGRIPSTMCW